MSAWAADQNVNIGLTYRIMLIWPRVCGTAIASVEFASSEWQVEYSLCAATQSSASLQRLGGAIRSPVLAGFSRPALIKISNATSSRPKRCRPSRAIMAVSPISPRQLPSAPHRRRRCISGLCLPDRSPDGAKVGQHIDIRMLDTTEIRLFGTRGPVR